MAAKRLKADIRQAHVSFSLKGTSVSSKWRCWKAVPLIANLKRAREADAPAREANAKGCSPNCNPSCPGFLRPSSREP